MGYFEDREYEKGREAYRHDRYSYSTERRLEDARYGSNESDANFADGYAYEKRKAEEREEERESEERAAAQEARERAAQQQAEFDAFNEQFEEQAE